VGELDVFLACKQKYFIGPLDEYSWKAEEKQLYELFHFEEAKIPTGEQVHVGDRLGMYYKAREGEKPMRLVVAPYEGGLVLLWGIAGSMHPAQLDETMKAAMASVKFTGPNGGQQAITLGDRINYWVKYRPSRRRCSSGVPARRGPRRARDRGQALLPSAGRGHLTGRR
jgi:hypothetical protein